MYAIKGFVAHSAFSDNAPSVIAKLGEVSKKSLTYSRESGQYVSPAAAGLTLISFLSTKDGTTVIVPPDLAEQILTFSKFIYDRTLNHAGEQFSDELLADLMEAYDAVAENFSVGQMINDGRYYMPEWVSWVSKNQSGVDVDNSVRIWFSDESFQLEYDSYEIVVVPPVDRLDDFFKTGTEVGNMLTAITTQQAFERVQAATTTPATVVRSDPYNYIDPLNSQHIVPSPWTTLIYGQAGNNPDAIKDALMNYILANSTHTREEWVKILPDLFKRTEMILMPRWDKEAIPNRQTAAGVNSPVAHLTGSLADLKAFVPGYPEPHINSYAEAVPNTYKSLDILVVGGPENRDNIYRWTQLFPDYINVSSQSLDFDRMSVFTKQFLLKLESLLRLAETATEFSNLPQGYTRTKRDGKLYIVQGYENINYLVATKSNFTA